MASTSIEQHSQEDASALPHVAAQDKDAAVLARLGYKQELKRHFSPLEVFGISFSIIGIVPSVASVLVFAVPNGGPVAMVWGWAVSSIFLLTIALTIAELGSAVPTAGGLYWWTYHYASPGTRNFLCWLVGYNNTISYIAGMSSVIWGLAVQIMAAASIASDLTFAPTTPQIYGVYVAVLVVEAVASSMATKVIARLQGFYILINVLLCLALVIGLPAATSNEFKNPASFAFGNFENFSGWPNGYAFVLSFLAPLWSIGAFDSSMHISEEAHNANVAVPWAIVSATVIGAVLGWAINVAIVFNMGTDLLSVLENPIGQPMATIILNSFGKQGTLAVWSFNIIAQFMIGNSYLTAASRQIWAFSRDGALPGSRILYHINSFTGTPVYCVWFVVSGAALLGLLALAGEAAVSAVFTLSVVGQYISYSIPVVVRWVGGRTFEPGPFHLGKMSPVVSGIAVAWMTFMGIVLMFPSSPAPVAANMNYSVVVLGGALLLSVVYYFVPVYGGREWFKGPVHTAAEVEEKTTESSLEGGMSGKE